MKSYIVQLDFSAAFDRVSHSGLLFRGGSVLSICREFPYNCRQRVMVEGVTSEWTPIVSGMPLGRVLDPLQFILYSSEMFEQVENRLYAYADDSTLLAVVRKPADRSAVAAYPNKDVARIQEWCNHWCKIMNPNKTKSLVVSKSRTVNPPHGDLVLSRVSICTSPTSTFLV